MGYLANSFSSSYPNSSPYSATVSPLTSISFTGADIFPTSASITLRNLFPTFLGLELKEVKTNPQSSVYCLFHWLSSLIKSQRWNARRTWLENIGSREHTENTKKGKRESLALPGASACRRILSLSFRPAKSKIVQNLSKVEIGWNRLGWTCQFSLKINLIPSRCLHNLIQSRCLHNLFSCLETKLHDITSCLRFNWVVKIR